MQSDHKLFGARCRAVTTVKLAAFDPLDTAVTVLRRQVPAHDRGSVRPRCRIDGERADRLDASALLGVVRTVRAADCGDIVGDIVLTPCPVRREGDEIACTCGKRWAADDPDPPICATAPPADTAAPRAKTPAEIALATCRAVLARPRADSTACPTAAPAAPGRRTK